MVTTEPWSQENMVRVIGNGLVQYTLTSAVTGCSLALPMGYEEGRKQSKSTGVMNAH
jgi:hypothetical protein